MTTATGNANDGFNRALGTGFSSRTLKILEIYCKVTTPLELAQKRIGQILPEFYRLDTFYLLVSAMKQTFGDSLGNTPFFQSLAVLEAPAEESTNLDKNDISIQSLDGPPLRSPLYRPGETEDKLRKLAANRELRQLLLSYKEFEVLKLRCGYGDGFIYTNEEIGRIFRRSPHTISAIVRRALRKLHSADPGLFQNTEEAVEGEGIEMYAWM